jgi:G3E family GTPase
VVTTIDALNGAANLQEFAVCRKQATSADVLVLTKLDLAEPQAGPRLRQELQALNPAGQVLDADAATELAALLLAAPDPQTPAPGMALARKAAGGLRSRFFASGTTAEATTASKGMHGDIHSFVLQIPQAMDWTVFGIWLSLLLHAHGERVLRVKGLLQVQGAHTPVVVHGVQQLVYPPTHLARWPDGPRQSELVFIVRGLEQAAVEASLQGYLLRFA